MDISIYLPDSLAKRLDEYLDRESTTISKDDLIAKCIESFLEEHEDKPKNGWSDEILNWARQDRGESDEELEIDRLPWREFEL